jgi:hypothetical protein
MDHAVRLFVVTLIGLYVAPAGTFTVIELTEALVTTPLTAPKYTILLAGIGLKLLPVIVTVVPIVPLKGENEVICGFCP